ncbi:MAG: glycosyltransferase [Verrucomicrobia bacterium]|nr:glycosyltransferase [Verrucomicrobiota bacterium]
MKILHVVPTYLPAVRYGGTIRSVHGLCVALTALGHEVHVFTTNVDGDGNSKVALCQSVDVEGVQVWYFPSRTLRRLYWSPKMKKALLQAVPGFDLVHLHSVFLWPTWAAARVANQSGVPYVVSPRGMLVKDLVRRKSKLLKLAWTKLIERHTLVSASAIHVTAEKELDGLRRFDFDLPVVWTVPNGLNGPDVSALKNADDFPGTTQFALFLGRINWKKGLDRLIEAWKDVPNATLLIAGNDEESYQSNLERLATKFGVAERIRFVGMVQGESKWRLFRDAELFILPSYSENFGMSVLEAMFMGCPVVVTPEVGLAEAIAESKAGLVVAGDPTSLSREIGKLLGDADRRQEMGANGRRLASTRYSWRRVAGQMVDKYETIVADHV